VITIFIEVLRRDQGDPDDCAVLREGTFKQPFPLARIAPGTPVQWRVKRGRRGDTFKVIFLNGSPFQDAPEIDETTKPLTVAVVGNFKYQVYLTDGKTKKTYAVDHCPILDSDS
jgi:hypothetical protein